MATDFRDGKTFPRRGRTAIGSALWLARVSDKARAAKAGTIHDYVYPCPMDQGVLDRWGVSVPDFETALAHFHDDAALHAWLTSRVAAAQIEAANRWLIDEKSENLDRQDREEADGVV